MHFAQPNLSSRLRPYIADGYAFIAVEAVADKGIMDVAISCFSAGQSCRIEPLPDDLQQDITNLFHELSSTFGRLGGAVGSIGLAVTREGGSVAWLNSARSEPNRDDQAPPN